MTRTNWEDAAFQALWLSYAVVIGMGVGVAIADQGVTDQGRTPDRTPAPISTPAPW
jgi:hypothetical protein